MSALTELRMEQALQFLAETDEQAAELLSTMERLEHKAKSMRHTAFLHLQGSVADRDAAANTAPDVQKAYAEYYSAIREFNALKNKRSTEIILIECWRSINSSRKAGMSL